MKEAIRQRALELGFDDCRFTTGQPPASAASFLKWLREGRHGGMEYLERNAQKRVDPQLVLPGAKSIIVLAISYTGAEEDQSPRKNTNNITRAIDAGRNIAAHTGREQQQPNHRPEAGSQFGDAARRDVSRSARGVIARYARYQDYHDVLARPMETLTRAINQLGAPGTRSLWYVDTGPLLERDLAQRAGIGFVGKHTNVISRSLGNWVFLAEIITTLEFEPDAPERNRCGTCERCIPACPTGAITAPFQLDARRCISYLTIEHRGPIPIELRAAIGNRIYGCDDCLAVCPWNRFAKQGRLMRDHSCGDPGGPDLSGLLKLDERAFKQRFAGTPILRTKRKGLLRNVCVALGNVGDESAIPALEKAASAAEPLIAEHARWAINQIFSRCAK